MGDTQSTDQKQPMRTCIATGKKFPKRELLRIVFNPNTKEFEVDLRNKVRARGANIQPTDEAFELMIKKKALPRALKLKSDLTPDQYSKLREKFQSTIEEKNFRPTNKPVKIRIPKQD